MYWKGKIKMRNEVSKDIENTENDDFKPVKPKPVYIYNYGVKDKEFLSKEIATKDSEESRLQNKFVALVPAYATLLEPPECGENEIAVYSSELVAETVTEIVQEVTGLDKEGNPIFEEKEVTKTVKKLSEKWTIKPDFRTNFVKVDNDLNIFPITEIGEIEGFLIVDKSLGLEIQTEKDRYKIVDNKIVKKSEQEYEDELQQQERKRLDNLSMTRGDVFEALILAKGLGKTQIRTMIEQAELDTVTKALYLNRFDEALEFYRGYPIFDMLGQTLGITGEMLDKFFETKDYHELTIKEVVNENTTNTETTSI